MSKQDLKEFDYKEKRKELRRPLPAACQKYITMKAGDSKACLTDFSKSGLGFVTSQEFKVGEHIDCILSAPRSLSHKINLHVEVCFCKEISGEYIVGSLIKKVDDELWLDLFIEVYEYILKHDDEFY